MVLRLVLVGLVAGLGVTLPNQREMEALGRSAQRWVHARLAEWESRTAETSTFIYVADLPAAAPSESTQPVVSDQEFVALVEETVAIFAQADAASRPTEVDGQPRLVAGIAPGDATDSLAIAPPTEPAVVAADDPSTGDLAFEAVVDEMASTFAADLASLTSARRSELALEAMMEDLALEFTAVATTTVQPAHPDAAASGAPELDEDLYPGEAYALNRLTNEYLEPASPVVAAEAPTVVRPAAQESRLTHAVRLTREAVIAWTSLLHGPAVVAISR